MKYYATLFFVLCFLINCKAQKIANGTYYLNYVDMEYLGKVCGKCKAVVKGMKIKIIVVSDCHRKPKQIIEEGILMKHKTGVWIIGKTSKDKTAEDIGGCSGGPTIINFSKKRYESC